MVPGGASILAVTADAPLLPWLCFNILLALQPLPTQKCYTHHDAL